MRNDMASDISNTSHRFGQAFSDNRRRAFVATALFVSLLAFIALSEGSRGYRADLSLLVIPGKRTAPSTVEVMNDVVFLSKTSSFRSVFFKDTESLPAFMIMDSPDNFSDDATRKLFDSMVSVSSSGKGSVMTVSAFATDPDDAKDIARAAALSLSRYASRYYDVESTADFRIVDGPSASAKTPDTLILILESVSIGIVLSSIIFLLFPVVPGVLSYLDRRRMSLSVMPFSADIFQPKRPASPLLSDTTASERTSGEWSPSESPDPFFKSVSTVEPPISSEKKAPAPADVPTFSDAEERFLQEFAFETSSDAEAGHDEVNPIDEPADPVMDEAPALPTMPIQEQSPKEGGERIVPSNSEYQRRLNQLLRGE